MPKKPGTLRPYVLATGILIGSAAATALRVMAQPARPTSLRFSDSGFTQLTVSLAGTGSGTVKSNVSGINCPTVCSATYNTGASITLTASAATGSTFSGWSGACSGTGTCVVSTNSNQSVTATFNVQSTSQIPTHVVEIGDDIVMPSITDGTAQMASYLQEIAPYINWRLIYHSNNQAQEGHQTTPPIKSIRYVYAESGLPSREPVYDYYAANDPGTIAGEPAERDFAHDCSGNRVINTADGPDYQFFSPTTTQVLSMFKSYVQQYQNAGFDSIMFDAAGITWPISGSNLPCNNSTHTGFSRSAWEAATLAYMEQSAIPVLYNSLTDTQYADTNGISDEAQVFDQASSTSVLGGRMEDCYWNLFNNPNGNAANTPAITSVWNYQENTELKLARDGKVFACMQVDKEDPTTTAGHAHRIYTTASFLLTYDVNTSAMWSWYTTTSNIPIMPEQGLVPTNPLVASPATVSSLQRSTGAYAREYGACYLKGSSVGPCAVVMNPTTGTVSFPLTGYIHSLQLTGGGVFDGGTVSVVGAAPPSSLASGTAAIVFKN